MFNIFDGTQHFSFFNFWLLLSALLLQLVTLRYLLRLKSKKNTPMTSNRVVLDSCALIDGRILSIAETGFLAHTIIVPQRVLHELQLLADTADHYKRSRARFGLDIVKDLQKALPNRVIILEDSLPEAMPTDTAITEIALQQNAVLCTIDYNLNKVATIKKVTVLNVNELAHALRPAHLPGETVKIKIVQKGEVRGQGVGYLEEGTMVVVDGAANSIGKIVDASISRMLQTEAGRMVFAKKL